MPLAAQGWQEESLYNSAETFFSALLQNLSNAQVSIDLETYIFNYDSLGKQVVQALQQAQRRGVTVRVLMDGVGSYRSGSKAAEALEQSGIAVKIFHPLPWQIDHYARAAQKRGDMLDKLLFFISRINQRDHRKLCIVDHQQLWSGSFNISQSHLSLEAGGEGWHDYGVSTSGSLVAEVGQHFDSLWNRRKHLNNEGVFRYYWHNYGLWSRRRKNQLLLRHIRKASQRIWIVSAYFAPSTSVVRALIAARKRGVEVKIIVPSHSDVGFFPFLTATYYADLLKAGIRLFEYQPGILHAKYLGVDDLHLIGSTNFNHRSFLHDLELDISLHQPQSKRQLCAFFEEDLSQSIEVSLEHSNNKFSERWLGLLARVLRYWM